jgi:hypothetical protein
LNLGKIYEVKGQFSEAAGWYQRCLDTFSSVHSTEGVKSDAEKGMKRIKSRL